MAELPIHFRRCHCCLFVNCREGELLTRCEECGKHLAPFSFFDESKAMGLKPKSSQKKETTLPHNEYPPVRGLTVYWEP